MSEYIKIMLLVFCDISEKYKPEILGHGISNMILAINLILTLISGLVYYRMFVISLYQEVQ